MIFRSIRFRLQLWYGLFLALALAGFGYTAYHLRRAQEVRRVDGELNDRVGQLVAILRRNGPGPGPGGGPPPRDFDDPPPDRRGPPPGGPRGPRIDEEDVEMFASATDYFAFWNRDGGLIIQATNAPPDLKPPQKVGEGASQGFRVSGDYHEAYHFTPPGDCVLAGRSMRAEFAELHRFALRLAMMGGAVLLVGLIGGWFFSSLALKPIDRISAAASRIASGDLSHRIDAAETESELGRLTAVLNSTFARLDSAFQQQSQFTSDASHELRTPLAVILTQTQTALARERAADDYRAALEACQRAAKRMRNLTESLLQLARLDAGAERMNFQPFDLAATARETIDLLQPIAAAKNIAIHTDLPSAQINGDAGRIGQVIANLLTNAINYNGEGGSVHVAIKPSGTSVELTVRDTGPGIPAEDLPRLFRRFFRGDASRSNPAGSAGLGLAICKAILDNHHATIVPASEPGQGTTFTIQFPAA